MFQISTHSETDATEGSGRSDRRVLYAAADSGAADRLEAAGGGLTVIHEAGEAAAFERAGRGDVDCVVTEYRLGEGDGLSLLRAIREHYVDLPVVLVADANGTVLSDAVAADVDRYRATGADGVDYAALVEDVRAAIVDQRGRTAWLDRITEGFMALDREWRFTYLNDAAGEIVRRAAATKRDLEEYLGRNIWAEVPAAVDTEFHRRYIEAMDTQEEVSFEGYYDPLDEWFEVTAYPSPSGLSVSFRTITERRRYEDTLRRREEILRELYRITADKERSFEEKVNELLAVGRMELDTDYGVLSRIEGDDYIVENASTEDGAAVETGDVFPLSWTNCERAITTGETLAVNDLSEDPDLADREGNVRMGLTCYLGTPVVVDDEVTGTFCFFDDDPRAEEFSDWQVTLVDLMGTWVSYERERQERERRLARERDRLEQFASAVSHDLRNPLTVATANLEVVKQECDSDQLAAVERGLERMDALIDDVLSLARLGRKVIDPGEVALDALARAAWKSAGVEGNLVVESSATVIGDEARLQRLLENLFSNSADHADDGSGVTVRVGVLTDGFYVADDGPGIPTDRREEIFESGYSSRDEGTGFGLAIVQGIAEAHGGSVAVTEAEGGGARFEIRGLETR